MMRRKGGRDDGNGNRAEYKFSRSASSAIDVTNNAKDAGRRLLRKFIDDENGSNPDEIEASG